ncbi:MAG TPA: 5-amino-6-(D-ribitylamino)uracil--L-tyrosine 4-hydroxyphenyl transferase CofH [Stellaceae bacterium]|nr:5-amino-6-(D-ribitylamino)uracil--L-tyrosine 4-hydroxyphenyl transferase CofH [Stellaceae bacterium]
MAALLQQISRGARLSDEAALALADCDDLGALMSEAASMRDIGHGGIVTYSRKVFIPLTRLCRDSCHYCTFARPPRAGEAAYLSREDVLAIATAGARAGCKEALFTLGDKPELRYRVARQALEKLGHATTLSYLAEMAALVQKETGLLPHINAGVMDEADVARLRTVSVSQGLMLETASERLARRGGPHFGSPDKLPAARIATIAAAGKERVPFTSGILIGIGETRRERIEALLALRALHDEFGHIQEIIIQNFRAKPETRMAGAPEPDRDEQLWTIAVARLVFGAEMNIQSPPNLRPDALAALVGAGINDWGGVSPVTPDHVNPEAPWPELDALGAATAGAGKLLVERLAIYPAYALERARWIDSGLNAALLDCMDGEGLARPDGWVAGAGVAPPPRAPWSRRAPAADPALSEVLARAADGAELAEDEIVRLFAARGAELNKVCDAADKVRAERVGNSVRYVVNRNINYTNVCYFRCKFCAFSKGKLSANLRGRPYDLALDEVRRRVAEAWERGATEICLQGGIHPEYTGATYLDICRAVKEAAPAIHVHAFSPLEVWQGAATLGLSLAKFLEALRDAGLGSLPGTAAEILDDPVRAVICPDKIKTAQWLEVVETAHRIGLKSTATIMYGHVETPAAWARHLLHLRRLQQRTGGITEFVPLPFVPMETPLYLRHGARRGPTWREALLMHAVARLALNPVIPNIQASWVKLGPEGVAQCLAAGVNDVGGTLMNETITRSAGAVFGEEMSPAALDALIRAAGREPGQRTTLYGTPTPERIAASNRAAPLEAPVNTPARKYERASA